jgi:predicted deacylase
MASEEVPPAQPPDPADEVVSDAALAPPVIPASPPPVAGDPFRIGDKVVPSGVSARIDLPVARLFTGAWLSLPVTVLHGAKPGPRLWLDAAIHGDELNGMEIIRRVLAVLDPATLAGVVVAVPVVNVFGFVHQSRYLPDRRDLNRSFPGSARGSMTARLARLFIEQVVEKCSYGIDLHTGSQYRTNLPQIRAALGDPETRRIAEAFAAPLMYTAAEIPGSLRAAARRRGAHLLVYEAGEPLRFDETAIRMGVDGILRVLSALGMREHVERHPPGPSFEAGDTHWVRAPRSGIFHHSATLGDPVVRHQQLGFVTSPWGGETKQVLAPFEGIVIGFTSNPLVYRGDALIHVARKAGRGARPTPVDGG